MNNKIVTLAEVETVELFKEFVDRMEMNVIYEMPDNFNYESIELESDSDGYGWITRDSYRKMGSVHTSFPMKNSQYVKTFKTVSGAKRSLIKHCLWIYRN